MKYLLPLCLGLLFSCKSKEKIHDKRYFFISFRAMEEERSHDGNFYMVRDSMPSITEVKNVVYGYLYCDEYYPKDRITIMCIFEFKDSIDYLKFRDEPTDAPMQICFDTLDSRHMFRFELSDTTGYINFKPDTLHWSRKVIAKSKNAQLFAQPINKQQ